MFICSTNTTTSLHVLCVNIAEFKLEEDHLNMQGCFVFISSISIVLFYFKLQYLTRNKYLGIILGSHNMVHCHVMMQFNVCVMIVVC